MAAKRGRRPSTHDGAILEGLFWLTIVAVVLMIGTGIYGWLKRKTSDV